MSNHLVAPHMAPVVLLEEVLEPASTINRHSTSDPIVIKASAFLDVIDIMAPLKPGHAQEVEARLAALCKRLPIGSMRDRVAMALHVFHNQQSGVGGNDTATDQAVAYSEWPRRPRIGDDVSKIDIEGIHPISSEDQEESDADNA